MRNSECSNLKEPSNFRFLSKKIGLDKMFKKTFVLILGNEFSHFAYLSHYSQSN